MWRRLKQLGVAQIGDGLVGLPQTEETREQLDWVAEQVIEADGQATVWVAQPTLRADAQSLAATMTEARNAEYEELIAEISAADSPADHRTVARWRRELRRIDRRDHFGADRRDIAHAAISDHVAPAPPATVSEGSK